MKEISLIINEKEVKGKEGDTVLNICQANGIDIPTLCHMEGLTDIGACRLCVVNIEGERRPVPACTYPARNGLIIRTHTPDLEQYRRLILELIFTERNHYCMFCEKSGDCELQDMAYRYQMDHVRYPYTYPVLLTDSINSNIVIDHNRCILCGRCVRTCRDITSVHAIDFAKRGYRTTISADLNQSFGQSSCITCGACVQTCPTGAILAKTSMYKGKKKDCQKAATTCPVCGVGCQINALVKDNNVIHIESVGIDGARSALCQMGRFQLIKQEQPRITTASIRSKTGKMEECSVDKAVDAVAARAKSAKGGVAGLVSSRYPEEILSQVHKALGKNIDTIDGNDYRLISKGIAAYDSKRSLDIECSAEEITSADCIMMVGANPLKTNPVIASMILKAVNNGAKLIVIDAVQDSLPLWTTLWLKPKAGNEGILLNGLAKLIVDKGWAKNQAPANMVQSLTNYKLDGVSRATGIETGDLEAAASIYAQAQRGVIIYGDSLLSGKDASLITSLLLLAGLTGNTSGNSLRVISLKPNANSRGAWQAGLAAKDIWQDSPSIVYLLLDNEIVSDELLNKLKKVDFLVVQASRKSPVTEIASVVLPAPEWTNREGTLISLDGQVNKAYQVVQPGKAVLQARETFAVLAKKLGHGAG